MTPGVREAPAGRSDCNTSGASGAFAIRDSPFTSWATTLEEREEDDPWWYEEDILRRHEYPPESEGPKP